MHGCSSRPCPGGIKVTQLYAKATGAITRQAVNALPAIEVE
jgi:hypothetical protein